MENEFNFFNIGNIGQLGFKFQVSLRLPQLIFKMKYRRLGLINKYNIIRYESGQLTYNL